MHSLPQYSNLGYIHLVGRCMLSLFQVLFHHPCFAIESDISYYFYQTHQQQMSMGNGAWRRWSHKTCGADCTGYPWQPVSGNHQAPSHWIYVKTKILTTYLSCQEGWQEKPGCKYVSPCMQAPATPHTDPWGKTAGQHCFMFNLS